MGMYIRFRLAYIPSSSAAMQRRATSSSMSSSKTTIGVAPRRRKTSRPPLPSRSFCPRRFRRSANSIGNMDGRIVASGIYLTSQPLTGSVMLAMPILKELKQTRPFVSANQEATVALLRTADVVNRLVDAVIAREGITGQQYNVLRILRGAGEK